MAGLILKLRPHEELMVNGVVLENGDRNARIRVKTEGAHILRMRDAIKPEEATTPLKRAFYIAQLAVAGQISNSKAADILTSAIESLVGKGARDEIVERLAVHDFYGVMRLLRNLTAQETKSAAEFSASPAENSA